MLPSNFQTVDLRSKFQKFSFETKTELKYCCNSALAFKMDQIKKYWLSIMLIINYLSSNIIICIS